MATFTKFVDTHFNRTDFLSSTSTHCRTFATAWKIISCWTIPQRYWI